MKRERSGVAVVVSGGGARGAYEGGVLAELLPALDAKGLRPNIFVGTSAGAINAVGFAAMSHLCPEEAAYEALKLWQGVRWSSVFRSPLAALVAPRGGASGRRRAKALLDTTPLAATLGQVIDWDQLHVNVDRGKVSVGVVATAAATRRSTVFLETASIAEPKTNECRSIDYVATRLEVGHVVASSAIPLAFPPVEVSQPSRANGWYVDGGLRLNTPLKPALDLLAKRLVVIATDPAETATDVRVAGAVPPPSAAGGLAHLLYALLTDRMVEDLRTLARKNEGATGDAEEGYDAIRWLFAGPSPGSAGPLAELAGQVVQGRAPGQRRAAGPRQWVGSWLARDPGRLEVLTHLLFDPEFINGAIELGRRDARRSLDRFGLPVWNLTGGSPTSVAPIRVDLMGAHLS